MSNANLGLVLDGWIDALRRNDLEAIERHLHPDVVWHGVREDLVCPDREHVLANIRSNGGRLPEVDGIELLADGDRVLFGVRSPDLVEVAGEPLDGEIYNVFTLADGLIVRMDEFKARADAIAAMGERRDAPAAPVLDLIEGDDPDA
jgi:ketosteroid isomerase-like protein